jgi:hypothetical protein
MRTCAYGLFHQRSVSVTGTNGEVISGEDDLSTSQPSETFIEVRVRTILRVTRTYPARYSRAGILQALL